MELAKYGDIHRAVRPGNGLHAVVHAAAGHTADDEAVLLLGADKHLGVLRVAREHRAVEGVDDMITVASLTGGHQAVAGGR